MKSTTFFTLLLMSMFSLSIFMFSCEKSETLTLTPQESVELSQRSDHLPQIIPHLDSSPKDVIKLESVDWGYTSESLFIIIGEGAIHCTFPPCPCGMPCGYCVSDPWKPWLPNQDLVDPWHSIANASISGQQIRLVFETDPTDDVLVISEEFVLSTDISEPLGFPLIRLVPGEYPIDFSGTPMGEVFVGFTE